MTEFSGSPGPAIPLGSDPLQLFSLFFDDNVINLIVREANRYASTIPSTQRSRRQWSTTPEEIRAYLGFSILMGINHLPEIRDYWSTSPLLHYSPIADRISRDRFEEVTRYLHFVDNDTLPSRGELGFSRIQKVQPILMAMKERCLSVYKPHCEVAVDEAMIPFKGRSTMKQYQPKKPVKRGFKVWCLADSHNGYFCDFNVYVGSTGESPELLLGERVVLKLAESIEGLHELFFDNFFTSFPLMRTLLSRQIYAVGTVRTNRKGFPSDALGQPGQPKPQRGDIAFRQSGNLVVTVWQDKKPVTLASTACDPTATSMVRRRQKDGSAVMVPCPDSVTTYNTFMNGVDRGDQMRGYYHVRLKCVKNYKYIFWFLFDVAVTNAYIVSQYTVPTDVKLAENNLKSFKLRLATQLTGTYKSQKCPGRPSLTQQPQQSPQEPARRGHWSTHGPSRRCAVCTRIREPRQRHETVWHCQDCDGNPPLCLTGRDDGSDCFRLWHSQGNN